MFEAVAHEEHNIAALFQWVIGPTLGVVGAYKQSLERFPNPPAANISKF
jgi:arylsulfatase